jgi:hypothetical protein
MDDIVIIGKEKIKDNIIETVCQHPKLKRNQVWCTVCGRTMKIDNRECLRSGYPKCCRYTMTIDSPEERGKGKI